MKQLDVNCLRWNCLSDVYLSERSRASVYINLQEHEKIMSTVSEPSSIYGTLITPKNGYKDSHIIIIKK